MWKLSLCNKNHYHSATSRFSLIYEALKFIAVSTKAHFFPPLHIFRTHLSESPFVILASYILLGEFIFLEDCFQNFCSQNYKKTTISFGMLSSLSVRIDFHEIRYLIFFFKIWREISTFLKNLTRTPDT